MGCRRVERPPWSTGDRNRHWSCPSILASAAASAIQAGAIGLLGLGMDHLHALRAASGLERGDGSSPETRGAKARSVIYIFLSGGLSQHDSFDLKPDAPEDIRGEFRPIATRTPGLSICEHLPMLAQRSHLWSLVRSLTHPSNDHSAGHHIMLTGRSDLPPGFDPSKPEPTDWPSIAAVAGALTRPRNNLPPAVVLPERLVHNTGRVIPGQFAGEMGPQPRPLVHRGLAVRPQRLRRLPGVRVRPPAAAAATRQGQAVRGPEPDPARGLRRPRARRAG